MRGFEGLPKSVSQKKSEKKKGIKKSLNPKPPPSMVATKKREKVKTKLRGTGHTSCLLKGVKEVGGGKSTL